MCFKDTASSKCSPCTAGHYCGSTGLYNTTSGLCAAGHYCTAGAARQAPIGSGLLSANSSSTLPECIVGITYSNGVCPAGYYCEVGTEIPTQCPRGTFSNQSGVKSAKDCSSCLAGHYCDGVVLTTTTGSCMAGYYLDSVCTTINQCV